MFAVKNIKENYVLTYECFGGCGANQFDVRKFTTKEDAERSIKFFAMKDTGINHILILFKFNNIFAIRKSGNNKYSYVAE